MSNELKSASSVKTGKKFSEKRNNIGFDFGGWSEGLLQNNRYHHYDYFMFLNSSSIGPFSYHDTWPYEFIKYLKNNNIKLVGPTINANHKWDKLEMNKNPPGYNHVQSYVFCMNKSTLEYLIDCNIFSLTKYPMTHREAEKKYEILMSRYIIQNKGNIGCLHTYYQGYNFQQNNEEKKLLGDIMFNGYNNKLWSKEELIFIKGNRIHLD